MKWNSKNKSSKEQLSNEMVKMASLMENIGGSILVGSAMKTVKPAGRKVIRHHVDHVDHVIF